MMEERRKKTEKEFKEFLEEEFEDPEHSDVMVEKQSKRRRDEKPRG